MATKVGIGCSENPNSMEAAVEASKAALMEMDDDKRDLVIIYATEKHDPTQIRDGVRSVIGQEARIIGGYSFGIITKDYLGYDGFQVGVAVFSFDAIHVDMFIEKGLPDNEYNVGVALGNQIKNQSYIGEPNILLMYDSIKRPPSEGLVLNMATPLLEGISKVLDEWPPAAGLGMLGGSQYGKTSQWYDDQVTQDSALALVLSGGGIQMDSIIIHGCEPSGGYHTITKADYNVVLEIDGKPAVEMIGDLLGPDSGKSWDDFPLLVTLGENMGDKFGDFKEDEYSNRLVMAVDKERGGLVMFEPNLQEGTEIQLMRRSFEPDYVRHRSHEILNRIGDRTPFFALYIDCAGRCSAFSGTEREEAEEVQKVFDNKIPLLGIYSGVEIAKVKGNIQALDWTGVLCVFSQ